MRLYTVQCVETELEFVLANSNFEMPIVDRQYCVAFEMRWLDNLN